MARKPKTWVLRKPIDAVFSRDEGGETWASFEAEDVGLTFEDNDPAVAKALALYPDHFTPA